MTWIRYAAAGIVAVSLFACAPGEKERPPTVLFDEGHGQQFTVAGHGPLDLSGLRARIEAAGVTVATSTQELSDTILSGTGALVISGAFAAFTKAEIDSILRFLTRGGRLGVMLHIPQPIAPLLEQLGVHTSNGVIRERENVIDVDPMNFRVTRLAPHESTTNIDSIDVYGAWALQGSGDKAVAIAETSTTAWVDLNRDRQLQERDAVQSFAVAVSGRFGAGRFVIFGDDALFQNRFLEGNNEALATNLGRWLTARE